MSTTNEKPSEQKVDDLRTPSPRQQVSNRSILRIQQLSDALRDDLNRMELFQRLGGARQVLFAAIDQRASTDTETWYNFRLCATCGFDEKAIDDLKKQEPAMRSLFQLAKDKWDPHTSANVDCFFKNLEHPENNDTRCEKALDQLLIALAVVPYRGVLVSLMEKAFFGEKPTPGMHPLYHACFFTPETTEDGVFSVLKFDGFQNEQVEVEPQSWDDFEIFFGKEAENDKKIDELFNSFILPFTRGAWPIKAAPSQGATAKTKKRTDADIYGFAVPAYDEYCPENGWRGGMTGWLVVFLGKPHSVNSFYNNNTDHPDLRKMLLRNSWPHFTDLVHTYVRRVREANIRDLLEDYAEPDGTHEQPREFFLKYLHQVIGFRSVQGQEGGESGKNIKELSVPPDIHREEVKAKVIPLSHTYWKDCGEPKKGTTFPPGTRRLCAMFLDELELVRAKREEGGFLQADIQFRAVGHELHRIILSIDKAPLWLLPTIKASLSSFALPAFVNLDNAVRANLPPDLYGREPAIDFPCWIKSLVRLAAEIEVYIPAAKRGEYPDNQQDYSNAVDAVVKCFGFEELPCDLKMPDWRHRCYWGTAMLCAFRNTIKHCFIPNFDCYTLSYSCAEPDKPILVTVSGTPNRSICITNQPRIDPTSKQVKPLNDGSAGAINYYLAKLAESLASPDKIRPECVIPREPNETGFHQTIIPLLQYTLQ